MNKTSARTVHAFLRLGTSLLQENGIDSPALSTQLLAAKALNTNRLSILVEKTRRFSPDQWELALDLLTRRSAGEPLAYILGEKEFFGRTYHVTTDVLIPRPETELLIELAADSFPPSRALRFADLGTGTGVIAVSVAGLFPMSRGIAIDISPGALQVAKENARRHQTQGRIGFIRADFGSSLPVRELDLILSNPPYVSEGELPRISREVSGYEPRVALDGGEKGLEAYQALARPAFEALKSGGVFAVEVGMG
ncbi:MAG: peptide chain release factor N(5)-glutamine methyltransferase, partial [Desulfovibrionales bacterium]